ncbi:fasciclin domain-containing protein [Mesonia aquimarina]|uniref:fasciclin domain-containing protein n=1 Tax=Mesonia aquimarina TaxID=1504967 RepID=UPI000EF5EAD3|nr:fasciclin domain-containing protein [Mesonia aquimarina]
MKIKNLFVIALLSVFAFTSCKDDKKKDDMKDSDNMTEMNDSDMDDTDMDDMDDDSDMDNENSDKAIDGNMNLAEIAMASPNHSTLVSALQSSGMVVKLETDGPYTIFAPTNNAFNNLPKGTVENLMMPENKEKLEGVLSYHIVPGNLDAAKIKDLIKNSNNNKYQLETANKGKLMAMMNDNGDVVLKDGTGKEVHIVAADMNGSNGVIHSIDAVMMRK